MAAEEKKEQKKPENKKPQRKIVTEHVLLKIELGQKTKMESNNKSNKNEKKKTQRKIVTEYKAQIFTKEGKKDKK